MVSALERWERAWCWRQHASFLHWIDYINRMHRSGPYGEWVYEQSEQWERQCEALVDRAWRALTDEEKAVANPYDWEREQELQARADAAGECASLVE